MAPGKNNLEMFIFSDNKFFILITDKNETGKFSQLILSCQLVIVLCF